MFTLFLTSSPCNNTDGAIFEENGLRDELLRQVPTGAHALMVASDPSDTCGNDMASVGLRCTMERAGLSFASWKILDRRNQYQVSALVRKSDFIILCGGHVPTQHHFFSQIYLREELRAFQGVLLTISAGSMNCADIVYSLPEYQGEAISPAYQRFFPGLGLTSVQILPHYYMWKGGKVDDLLVYEEIAAEDSIGRRFYVFPDGTYLFSKFGYEEIRGEAYIIENGIFRQVCEDGQKVLLPII